MEIKKSEKASIRDKRVGLLQLGLITAMAICLSAFEYTSFEKETVIADRGTVIPTEIIDEYVPDVKIEPVKPNLPQTENNRQTSSITLPGPEIRVVNTPVNPDPVNPFVFTEPGDTLTFAFGNPDPEPVDLGEFTIVEDMPYYIECQNIKDKAEREACTQKMMFQKVGSTIKYPSFARENNIQGTVYVTFRVNTKGEIDDITIKRGVQQTLDEEALRVISKLPSMVPGEQRGKKVNVRYTVPIKFALKN